jgi:hypothetical protein
MSSTAKRAILLILGEIDTLDCDEEIRKMFRKTVHRIAVDAGVSGIDRQARIDYTRNLIADGATVLAMRDRLMAAFRISRTESYRLIATAREASQKMHELGTLSAIDSMCRTGVQTNLETRTD